MSDVFDSYARPDEPYAERVTAALRNIAVTSDWQIATAMDFNADGRADLLRRSDAGQLTDWLATPADGFTDNGINSTMNVPTTWRHMRHSIDARRLDRVFEGAGL